MSSERPHPLLGKHWIHFSGVLGAASEVPVILATGGTVPSAHSELAPPIETQHCK